MKKSRLVLLVCCIIANGFLAGAQSITPEKSTIEHNGNLRPCIVVHLNPETKTLKKAWVKFLKKEYDFKLKGTGFLTNRDLLSAEDVVVAKLSTKQMDFYTQVVEDENYSEMNVFISLGYDIYISEEDYPEEFKSMNEMLVRFLKVTYLNTMVRK